MLTQELRAWIEARAGETEHISKMRRERLQEIAGHKKVRRTRKKTLQLLFVCTHNSRRSQMAQALTAAAVDYYGINHIMPLSAGTQATAFHFYAVMALEKAGFIITRRQDATNPVYMLQIGEKEKGYPMFSKSINDTWLKASNFIAIMVCAQADANSRVVPGAAARFSLHYKDPGHYNKAEDPLAYYDQTLKTIGREMVYFIQNL